MRQTLAVGFLALIPIFSGCIGDDVDDSSGDDLSYGELVPPGPRLGDIAVVFTLPRIIDPLRAGGEPVIAIADSGAILVAAHPGYTHWHPDPSAVPPTSAELVAPTQGQSYMWRSEDGGETFNLVTLLPVENPPNGGPRGLGQGVSDPEFTVDGNGRIWFTDLEGLAMASLSWSDDDGKTWLQGNNAASGGPIDRQWLASHQDTLYFTGNYFTDRRLLATQDGIRFERRGNVPCGGDLVVNPLDGHLVAGCGNGIAVSGDGGKTWKPGPSKIQGEGPITPEPAIDAAGTIYRVADPERTDVTLEWTKDEGKTWTNLSLLPFFPDLAKGTLLWPWVSAGSADRVSVTFFASPAADGTSKADAEWFVYNAIVLNATTASPVVYPSKVTPQPFHRGPMCQGGTACQLTTATSDASDRRLGDFFETTVDREGVVHIVWSDTQAKPSDTISHVGYARLTDGPRLIDGDLPPGFPTQG